jgi:hypothetical protein
MTERPFLDQRSLGGSLHGWPEGFFERVAGSMPELRRGSQGEFEERLPLE